MSDLQAVFFDMDGTLVHTESTWLDAEIAVAEQLGGTWTPEDQAAHVGGPLPKVGASILRSAGRDDLTPDEVGELLNAEVERLLRTGPVHWMPGAKELLDEVLAAGVPVALVSASYRRLVDAVLAAVGDAFTTTVAGDEVAELKPAPHAYLEAARRLGVEPARCVVLEDSPTGVRAGEAAGCPVVAVPSVAPVEPAPGRTVVTSLEQVDLDRLRRLVR
ncbi:HAD superfamily hydrolase (TIGR01509 family)/HAD superfamily hydrolase (TIGR01549 family) [Motilibacter rhizosphaerae]|uniref:HAD superfamily hydrolase (TIGR01509 family)/HAD superfamily hydrolase (TIGR01549 family) n=1 Tax=Motilibacter rhizosphaerae TaxID=598652 RepID=A0A4Q7NBR2_9ACTN|nr:HAD family phosphatase [Motilibacter rhizosphaerae]RZS80057.1 HAD superfamily hydrolase (TIGR01509 family)/HAD superfamily hydrolase (TIGR01549 family) [Motilibacter rhizosphaerae]